MNAYAEQVRRAREEYVAAHARFLVAEESFNDVFTQRRRSVLADVPARQAELKQQALKERAAVLEDVRLVAERLQASSTLRAHAPWSADAWSKVREWEASRVLRDPEKNAGEAPEDRFDLPDALDAALLRLGSLGQVAAPALLPNPARANLTLLARHEVAATAVEILLVRMLATTANVQVHVLDTHNTGRSLPAFGVASSEKDGVLERPCATDKEAKDVVERLMGRVREVSSNILQGRFSSLLEYNAKNPAETVHVLVCFDVETYSQDVLEGLEKLSRASDQGIFLLTHSSDPSRSAKPELLDAVFSSGVVATANQDGNLRIAGFPVTTLESVPYDLVEATIHWAEAYKKVSQRSVDLVELLATSWTPAADDLKAVVGTAGNREFSVSLGVKSDPHMLVVGESGSGKSTFLHSFILALACAHSPEDLAFFLVDGKEGVEMVTYTPGVDSLTFLPHVQVAAVKSDLEMCLSVLRRVNQEIRSRNERFKDLGVQNILEFNDKGAERMPRLVVVVDEFQVLFAKSKHVDEIAQLMSDIAKRARSSGIHLVLATQSLKGLTSSMGLNGTLEQVTNRVALSCDAESSEIALGKGNTAASKLSGKGAAVYNKGAKDPSLNQRFQVGFVQPEPRAQIVEDLYGRAPDQPAPVVLQGGESVSVTQAGLLSLLATPPVEPALCLGGPLTIRGPIQVPFPLDYRHHLLVLGSDDPSGMLVASTLALAASNPEARFVLCESKVRGPAVEAVERLREVLQAAGRDVQWASGVGETSRGDVLAALNAEVVSAVKKKSLVNDGKGVYVVVPGSQGLPPKSLKDVLEHGFEVGVQVLAHAKDVSLVKDYVGSAIVSGKTVSSFGIRVLTSLDSTSKQATYLGAVVAKHPNAEAGRNTLDTTAIDNESCPFIPVEVPTAAEWVKIESLLEASK